MPAAVVCSKICINPETINYSRTDAEQCMVCFLVSKGHPTKQKLLLLACTLSVTASVTSPLFTAASRRPVDSCMAPISGCTLQVAFG